MFCRLASGGIDRPRPGEARGPWCFRAEVAEQIADALIANGEEDFEIDIDLPFDLEFTPADYDRLRKANQALIDDLPDLLKRMGDSIGRDVANAFRAQWTTAAGKADAERDALKRKIAGRWSEAFSDFRLLLELCANHGDAFNHANLDCRLKRNHLRNEALSRLHIRACRIAEEIITLLEHGFVEAARARWRTMLEVSVTALLIAEGGDPLAERYLDHGIVDRKKELDDRDRAGAILAGGPVRALARREIEAELARAVRRYGAAFRGMHGWAGGQLGLPDKPHFHDLLEVAGTLALKADYRLACLSTHASPQMLSQPMHQWDPTMHIPGDFAAGFEEPGGNAAYTLVQITSVLFDPPYDLDALVHMRTLALVRGEVDAKLKSTARRIERDEQRAIDRAARRPGRPFRLYPRRR